ncbi:MULTISPECIES: hypothetical protein [Acidithrix]|uniref:Uncharacterized protein n=1 Tax=Acidithrix ferrooxidans TaxID=1280514 RepID=A0A0D8HLG9_9ACTN|nr:MULTISPECIES: hypothetical protein [Acidithrix]KJF18840.1 hypothetical protein AXFE_02450 [Acidithrix ferrooxidans]CAG4921846.1 unnamed protein product [Acidithrix sp. C25]
MTSLELESKIFRMGSALGCVTLEGGETLAPCELVSVSAGKHGTLWVSNLGEDIFVEVAKVRSISPIAI